jgi:NAD(P)-dependent dehydrogenase (short-subunit alcohol dehydrogenase family)
MAAENALHTSRSLEGTVALVTGAGRNIGRAIALRLAVEGAVVAVNDVSPERVRETAGLIRASGGEAIEAAADMTVPAEIDTVFAQVESAAGLVTALVNNAYVRGPQSAWEPFLRVGYSGWDDFLRTNLNMTFGCTQRAARALAKAGTPGSIVNLSSFGAGKSHRQHIPYDTAKGAIEAFTRATAVDLGPWGIRVNAVRPGTIAVEDDPVWGERLDERGAQIPLGRVGVPDDIAAFVAFLASADSSYITGQCLDIDGGMTVQARPPAVEPATPVGPATIGQFPLDLSPSTTLQEASE